MATHNLEIIVKATDMEEAVLQKVKMQSLQLMKPDKNYIIIVNEVVIQAMLQHKQEKFIANAIKEKFDKDDGYGWNCIVGKSFGSHIIHQTKKFVFFSINELSFLLWKA